MNSRIAAPKQQKLEIENGCDNTKWAKRLYFTVVTQLRNAEGSRCIVINNNNKDSNSNNNNNNNNNNNDNDNENVTKVLNNYRDNNIYLLVQIKFFTCLKVSKLFVF